MEESHPFSKIFEVQYPDNLKCQKEKKAYKLQKLKDMPETLTADYKMIAGAKEMCDLIFFTKDPGSWHTLLCNQYKNVKRCGISKGRQIQIQEDGINGHLTINVYNNGTVMIQGSEDSLACFCKSFYVLADTVKTETKIKTTGKQAPEAQNTVKTPPASTLNEIATLKNGLSHLEREFVEFRESNQNGTVLESAISIQKQEIEMLKCAVKDLEENNLSLQIQIRRFREEHLTQAQDLQRVSFDTNTATQSVTRCLSDEHLKQMEELQRDHEQSTLAMKTEIRCLRDEHLRQLQELQRDLTQSTLAMRTEMRCLRDEHLKHIEELQRDLKDLKESNLTTRTEMCRLKNEHLTEVETFKRDIAMLKEELKRHPTRPTPTHYNPDTSYSTEHVTVKKDSHKSLSNNVSPTPHTDELPSEMDQHRNTQRSPKKRNRFHEHSNPEIILLSDSNGKYINMKRLFPKHRTLKLWCPTTSSALKILDDERLKDATHIIIHTGTNDLTSGWTDVGKAMREVALKATTTVPTAKILISSLLPRLDKPPQQIQEINKGLQQLCSTTPQLNLVEYPNIRLEHMFDHIHLDKNGIRIMAKAMKDIALDRIESENPKMFQTPIEEDQSQKNRTMNNQSHDSVFGTQRMNIIATSAPKDTQCTYSATVANPSQTEDTSNQIRDMLALICSKLLI